VEFFIYVWDLEGCEVSLPDDEKVASPVPGSYTGLPIVVNWQGEFSTVGNIKGLKTVRNIDKLHVEVLVAPLLKSDNRKCTSGDQFLIRGPF